MKFVVVLTLATAGLTAARQQPMPPLRAAAASDLQSAFSQLAAGFEREHQTTVTPSFGSSGNFFAQIQNGAPFDLFFSADVDYPKRLIDGRLADADSLYEYATGRIVIWTRNGGGVDVKKGLAVLRDARVRRVAIANPDHAPYGRAAVAAMKAANVYDAAQPKLVLGENISQTAQLADSGNADVGIIALALAMGPAMRASGSYLEIPATAHPPITQAVVVISSSRHKGAARAFIDSLRGRAARQIFENFGFVPPPALRPLTR